MMPAAEWDGELIADLAAERTGVPCSNQSAPRKGSKHPGDAFAPTATYHPIPYFLCNFNVILFLQKQD
jgi:hypothetical protein